ncbi:MAG: Vitamin B12 dependent methionine synthase activation subunit [Clostridia bacterium]|nr:Vitamin B12 dependent methionine synthase activation subunit [Clostridia bacterium]
MSFIVYKNTYPAPMISKKEILRYSGAKNTRDLELLLDDCVKYAKDKISYNVCYCELPVTICDDICDFGVFSLQSKDLALNLKGCKKVLIFAATLGIDFDRVIAKYSSISPATAVMLDAFGVERIEALCDTFCLDMQTKLKLNLKPRFSAGYGDLPLDAQKQIFSLLDCPRQIGLTLNDSLMMSPSKSVTAFIGIQSP